MLACALDYDFVRFQLDPLCCSRSYIRQSTKKIQPKQVNNFSVVLFDAVFSSHDRGLKSSVVIEPVCFNGLGNIVVLEYLLQQPHSAVKMTRVDRVFAMAVGKGTARILGRSSQVSTCELELQLNQFGSVDFDEEEADDPVFDHPANEVLDDFPQTGFTAELVIGRVHLEGKVQPDALIERIDTPVGCLVVVIVAADQKQNGARNRSSRAHAQ